MNKELENKVSKAIHLLKVAAGNNIVEVSYSGGKDSDVILELAKMSGIKYRAIYKNTTIDPVGTIKHCRDKKVEIRNPKTSYLKLIENKGLPTRRARFCCRELKEYKILDIAIQGIRRSESQKRAKRYKDTEPVICRFYGSKKNHVNVILPILTWSDKDIEEFIIDRNIKCHPLYYDEKGNFHVERRLGCLGCPMRSDNGKEDYKKNPKFFKLIVKSAKKWWNTHPAAKSQKKFGNIYGLIAHNLFYRTYNDWKADDINLFGATDWKKFLENYFKIELD